MAQSAGKHAGATPEQRLAAVRALAPSAASNLGGGDRGEIGISVAEIARKLGAALRVSIEPALSLSLTPTPTLTLPPTLTITLTLTLMEP